MWPEILWHFVARNEKNKPSEQFDILKKIIGVEGKNAKLKLTIPFLDDGEIGKYASCAFLSMTSLPKDLICEHRKEYGSLAIGFSKKALEEFAIGKGYVLNPVLYIFTKNIKSLFRDEQYMQTDNHSPSDSDYFITNFTKSISDKNHSEYNYFHEQEWRLFVDSVMMPDLFTDSSGGVSHEGPSSKKMSEQNIVIDIPITTISKFAVETTDLEINDQIKKYCQEKIKEIQLTTFDELHHSNHDSNQFKTS